MNFLAGKKTFILAGVTFTASVAGIVFDVPLKYAVYGLGILSSAMFVALRLGVKASFGRAYKIYVDRSDPTRVKSVAKEGTIPEWQG